MSGQVYGEGSIISATPFAGARTVILTNSDPDDDSWRSVVVWGIGTVVTRQDMSVITTESVLLALWPDGSLRPIREAFARGEQVQTG